MLRPPKRPTWAVRVVVAPHALTMASHIGGVLKMSKYMIVSPAEDLAELLPADEAEREMRMAAYAAAVRQVAAKRGLTVIEVHRYGAEVDVPEDQVVGLDVMQQIWDRIDVEDRDGAFTVTVRHPA